MRFEFPLPACLQRVLEVMEEHPQIEGPQVRVASLPAPSGYGDLVVDVAGFIVLENRKPDVQHEGIYARDEHDAQTCKRYVSVGTNYFGALGNHVERIAAENEVKLFKYDEGGGGDFGVTLPFDSSEKQIRNALDKLVNAVIVYEGQRLESARIRSMIRKSSR